MNAAAPRSRGGGKVAGRPTASRILHQKGPGAVPGAAMGQVYAWGGIRIRSRGAAGGGTSLCRRAAGGWRNRATQPAQRAGDTSSPSPSPKQQRKALKLSRSLTISPKTTQSSPKTIFPSPQTPTGTLRATGRGRLEKSKGLVPSEQNH